MSANATCVVALLRSCGSTAEQPRLAHSLTELVVGDQVLLASVGLTKTLTIDAIADSLAQPATDTEARVKALDARAKARGLRDDTTLILIEARAPGSPTIPH